MPGKFVNAARTRNASAFRGDGSRHSSFNDTSDNQLDQLSMNFGKQKNFAKKSS